MKSVVKSFYNWYSNSISHPKYRWVIILGTAAYLLSPIDISPDFIPLVGWIDDGVVVGLLVTELSRLALDFRRRRQGERGTAEVENTNSPETISVEAKSV